MPSLGRNYPYAKRTVNGVSAFDFWRQFWVKKNNSWAKAIGVYTRSNGSWVQFWTEQPSMPINFISFGNDGASPPTVTLQCTVTANGFDTSITGRYRVNSTSAWNSLTPTVATIPAGFVNNTGISFYNPSAGYEFEIVATNSSGSISTGIKTF